MKTKIKDKWGNIHHLGNFFSLYVETLCKRVFDNILDEYEYTDEEVTCPVCNNVMDNAFKDSVTSYMLAMNDDT